MADPQEYRIYNWLEEEAVVEIHSITTQQLDNNHIRIKVEYTTDIAMAVSVFDAPRGAFCNHSTMADAKNREAIIFDISNDYFDNIKILVVTYFFDDVNGAVQNQAIINLNEGYCELKAE